MRTMILAVLMTVSVAQAETTYLVNGKNATLVEAIQTKAKDPKAVVKRCDDQQLKEGKGSIGLKKQASN